MNTQNTMPNPIRRHYDDYDEENQRTRAPQQQPQQEHPLSNCWTCFDKTMQSLMMVVCVLGLISVWVVLVMLLIKAYHN